MPSALRKWHSWYVECISRFSVPPHAEYFRHEVFDFRDERYYDEGVILEMQTSYLDGKKEPKVPVELTGEDDPCGNLRSFYDAVKNGGVPYPSFIDGARAVAVVFAAEESAKTGHIVPVEKL